MDDEDRYTRITLRIPKDLHRRVSAQADRKTRSLNAEIVALLEHGMSAVPSPHPEGGAMMKLLEINTANAEYQGHKSRAMYIKSRVETCRAEVELATRMLGEARERNDRPALIELEGRLEAWKVRLEEAEHDFEKEVAMVDFSYDRLKRLRAALGQEAIE